MWHLLVYLVCISRASDSNLGWEWWDSSETHETTGDSRRRSERPVARGRCPKQTMSIHEPMIFVVMLWSSLAVFDLLISLVVSFPEAYPWEFSAGGFQHFEIILHSVPPSISSLYCGTSNFLPQILCLLQLEHNLDITITALV